MFSFGICSCLFVKLFPLRYICTLRLVIVVAASEVDLLRDSATTTYGKLQQSFEDDAVLRAHAFWWREIFSKGRTLVEDEQCSRRPSAKFTGDNTAWVRELVRSNRRLTVKMIAYEVNMNRKTVRLILTEDLGRRNICTKMAPRNLTEQQWEPWLSAAFDIQMCYGDATASLFT